MPVYEYECTKCGHRFEVRRKFTDVPITDCEKCSGEVRKVFSAVGIMFKGSGFHINDYGPNGEKKRANDESKSADGEKKRAAGETKSADSEKKIASGEAKTESSS